MQYLVYIEHNAENLQFYLWHKDYAQRFSNLPASEQALSPEYAPPREAIAQPAPAVSRPIVSRANKNFVEKTFVAEEVLAKEMQSNRLESPFATPPMTPRGTDNVTPFMTNNTMNAESLIGINHKQAAADAFDKVDVKWQPCMYARSMCRLSTDGF